jgi:hypothetical protein
LFNFEADISKRPKFLNFVALHLLLAANQAYGSPGKVADLTPKH